MALSAIHDPEGARIRQAHSLHRRVFSSMVRTATMESLNTNDNVNISTYDRGQITFGTSNDKIN